MTDDLLSLPRCYETPAGVRLGPLEAIADGASRAFVLKLRETRFHGFVVRQGNAVYGYVDRCPHAGLPLSQELDDYLSADGSLIVCRWHGALFSIEEGVCVGGPCMKASLARWPVRVSDGQIVTG